MYNALQALLNSSIIYFDQEERVSIALTLHFLGEGVF